MGSRGKRRKGKREKWKREEKMGKREGKWAYLRDGKKWERGRKEEETGSPNSHFRAATPLAYFT